MTIDNIEVSLFPSESALSKYPNIYFLCSRSVAFWRGDYFMYQIYRYAIHWLRHTAVKIGRLTNFDRKGVQIFY